MKKFLSLLLATAIPTTMLTLGASASVAGAASAAPLNPLSERKNMLFSSNFEGGSYTPNVIFGESKGVYSEGTELIDGMGYRSATALKLSGIQDNSQDASFYVVIHENVNVTVSELTRFTYCIKPDMVEKYEGDDTNHFVALDLVFTDGTRLSEQNVKDLNGDLLTPYGQGSAEAMISSQWNYIEADLGKAVAGKIIDKILVGYERPAGWKEEISRICTYLDDIQIYDLQPEEIVSKTQYVKTTRGTNDTALISRGACYPSTTVPNGFLSVTPSTGTSEMFIYEYHATQLGHFKISHQASVHLRDYNVLQFMPNTSLDPAQVTEYAQVGLAARSAGFSHDNEIDRPNYYSVTFDEYTAAAGVTTELTPTSHGFSARFTFPEDSDHRNLIFDALFYEQEYYNAGSIVFENDGTFTATIHNYRGGISGNTTPMYLYGVFSAAPTETKNLSDTLPIAMVGFDDDQTVIEMRVAASYISPEQAKKNMKLELDGNKFEDLVLDAQQQWDEILDLMEIEGASEQELITVYSSLYRMYSYPILYSENTGTAQKPVWQYHSPYSNQVVDGKMYTSNGFWDTYRTVWPAYVLLTPTLAGEMLDGILLHYKDSGNLGRWLNPTGVTCMEATNSDVIFADAAVKGVPFDYDTAYQTILQNAMSTESTSVTGRANNATSLFLGYSTLALGKSMEYSISDFAAAALARLLGKEDEARWLLNHSLSYANLYESESGFFISRDANGNFTAAGDMLNPFLWDPYTFGTTETNVWGHLFGAAFDGEGLAALFGGKEALAAKLDELLTTENYNIETTIGSTTHEMREGPQCRMGQYFHSNQPAHATLFLYNAAGQPYKTQAYTREVLDRLYVGSSFGQGYLGDEDNGEQSAWYLLSALGFYPLRLGWGEYTITSPLFDKVTLHLESGDLEIISKNNSTENVYIQSMTVDGQAWNSIDISHETLTNAKQIVFTMGDTPSDWGTGESTSTSILSVDCEPVAMTDRVPTDIATAGALTENAGAQVACSSTTQLKNLFNNTTSSAKFTAETNLITFRLEQPETVKMVTVMASENSAPSAVTVRASQTGEEGSWELLKSAEPTYTFTNQLVPLSLDNNTAYAYYQIEFTGACKVSELELLGYGVETPYGRQELEQLTQLTDILHAEQKVLNTEAISVAYQNAKKALKSNNVSDYNQTVLYQKLEAALFTQVSEEDLKWLTMTDAEKYQEVIDRIDALPEKITLDNEAAVAAACVAYDILEDSWKAQMDPKKINKLTAAEVTIVIQKIDALPDADAVTDENKTAVGEARAAYNALTESQKALVTNLSKLEAAEAALIITMGDINGDGNINASDALLALQHSVRLITIEGNDFTAADVDKNGKVDASDALKILQHSVRLIEKF